MANNSNLLKIIDLLEQAHILRRNGLLDRADSLVRSSNRFGGANYPQAFKLFLKHEPAAGALFPNPGKPDWNFARSQLKPQTPVQGLLDLQ